MATDYLQNAVKKLEYNCPESIRALARSQSDGQVFAVVHSAGTVLAAGDSGAGALSAGVAGAAAIPDPGHRRGWGAGPGARAVQPAGAAGAGDLRKVNNSFVRRL